MDTSENKYLENRIINLISFEYGPYDMVYNKFSTPIALILYASLFSLLWKS